MKFIRTIVGGAAAAALVIAGAPAAMAADFAVNACEKVDYMFPNGSVITIVYGAECSPASFVDEGDVPLGFSVYPYQGEAGISDAFVTRDATSVITLDSADAWTVVLSERGVGVFTQQWIASCGVLKASDSEAEGFTLDGSACPVPIADQTPAPIQQAVPLPASGTCTDVVESDFGFQARVTGGWGKSWGEWANSGAGGQVCERTLAYSGALARWTVQP